MESSLRDEIATLTSQLAGANKALEEIHHKIYGSLLAEDVVGYDMDSPVVMKKVQGVSPTEAKPSLSESLRKASERVDALVARVEDINKNL